MDVGSHKAGNGFKKRQHIRSYKYHYVSQVFARNWPHVVVKFHHQPLNATFITSCVDESWENLTKCSSWTSANIIRNAITIVFCVQVRPKSHFFGHLSWYHHKVWWQKESSWYSLQNIAVNSWIDWACFLKINSNMNSEDISAQNLFASARWLRP